MKKIWHNDFLMALLFLLAYLSTSPYIYGWDDQHLEIPILKHLIDPSLYRGDYYVESACKYFTCWLYPLLAKFITVKQIPSVYWCFFMISRYMMFYWVFRLWLWIAKDRFTAVCATLMFFLLGRTDEFLYRSFCHEEFSFIFMFAGFYCFWRERYLAAALLWGIGVNFHAIYNLFPMLYMLAFLVLCCRQRLKLVLQTGLVFTAASLPFLCWQIPISIAREIVHPVPVSEWMPLYLMCCPQNFLFGDSPLKEVFSNPHVWWNRVSPYVLLLGLYILNMAFNPGLVKDKKAHAVMGTSWAILGMVYFFDYVHPHRFALDLNLVRVAQYMRFLMMGYTTIWACDQAIHGRPWQGFAAGVLVLSCGTNNVVALFCLGLAAMIFVADASLQPSMDRKRAVLGTLAFAALGFLVYALGLEIKNAHAAPLYWHRFMYVLAAMALVFAALLFKSHNLWLRRALIVLPLAGQFVLSFLNCREYDQLAADGPGAWQMLRDWKDMQLYVHDHTPKEALIMTPYDMIMGGFRIHSERKVLVCYRDSGIIGFDYAAAQEWQRRITDIEPFKIYTDHQVNSSVMRAILKYGVDYVVFMKYYGPGGDNAVLKKIYENTVFSLFQVI